MVSADPTRHGYRLEQCLERIVDNRGRTPPLSDAGVEMIEINALEDGRKSPNYGRVRKFVSQETYATWFRSGHPKRGDTLISTVGAIGRVAYFNEERGCIAQNVIALRPKRDILDPEFLYYYLASADTQTRLANLNIGVAQPSLKVPHLLALEILLHPLPVQSRIAAILSAYDELMENCRRRIRILEKIAHNLYCEWFVHFRFPGHEEVPRVDPILGNIPEGWQVKRLDSLAEIKGGKQLEKKEIHEAGEFPVFGGNGIQGYSEKATHRGFVIAFGRVGAYCGAIHWSYGGAWLNNNSSSVVPLGYDELILHHLLDFHFDNLRGGAAQPFISNSALAGIELVFPGADLATRFCSLVKPLRLQKVNLENTVANLRRTRDLLLPRLLSGQVSLDVSAVEDVAEPPRMALP